MEAGAAEQVEKEQRDARTELLRLAREDPEFLDDLDQFERLMEFADSNPELMRDARAFVDASAD